MAGPARRNLGRLAYAAAIIPFASFVLLCGRDPATTLVTQEEYGLDWPFIVPEVVHPAQSGERGSTRAERRDVRGGGVSRLDSRDAQRETTLSRQTGL